MGFVVAQQLSSLQLTWLKRLLISQLQGCQRVVWNVHTLQLSIEHGKKNGQVKYYIVFLLYATNN